MTRSRIWTLGRHWSGLMAFTPSFNIVRGFCAPTVEVQSGRTKAGDWDAERYASNAWFVPELGESLFEVLAPRTGERILDVGCGDGVLTAELKKRGCRVVGIDFAPAMVAAAVKREVDAYVMDAANIDAPFLLSRIAEADDKKTGGVNDGDLGAPRQQEHIPTSASTTTATTGCGAESQAQGHPSENDADFNGLERQNSGARLDQESPPPPPPPPPSSSSSTSARQTEEGIPAFDAVFTNAALHWVRTPRAVIGGVKRVLRPGGRFVGEFGGHGNMAAVRTAMHSALWKRGVDPLAVDPWYFPTAEEYRDLLEEAGFIVDDVALVPRPTILPAGTGMRGWLSTFTLAFINAIPLQESEDPSGEAAGSYNGDSSSGSTNRDGVNGISRTAAIVLDEALASLQPALRDKNGVWTADYVRLRFKAHLPEDSSAGTAVDKSGRESVA